jgi:predicted O-methyltransferase YrrM
MYINRLLYQSAKTTLSSTYSNYTTRVSPHNWALSLETGALIYTLCESTQPKTLVDLGSGFSSYVVRSWRKQSISCQDCELWSVDDNPSWLLRAKEFCREQDVPVDNFEAWEQFEKSHLEPTFDIVVYDLGSMQMRFHTIERALKLCKPGGLFIIDDAHKNFYRNEVTRVCAEKNVPLESMQELTTDRIGRYCWIARMPS